MLNKGAKQYNKLLHSDIEGGSVNGNLTPAAMQGGPNGEEMPAPKVTGNVSDRYRLLMYKPSVSDALFILGLFVMLLLVFILLISLVIYGAGWHLSRH